MRLFKNNQALKLTRNPLEAILGSDEKIEVTLSKVESLIRERFYEGAQLHLTDEEMSDLYESEMVSHYLDQLHGIKYFF